MAEWRRPPVGLVGAGIVLLAVVFATSPAAAARIVFFDTFNEPDGPLGPPNWQVGLAGTAPPLVVNHAACGDEQSVAVYASTVSTTIAEVSFRFQAAADTGLEAYAVALAASGAIYIAGCDGGGSGGTCTPTIAAVGGAGVKGSPIPLAVDTPYVVRARFEPGSIDLTIADAAGSVLAQLSLSTAETFGRFGFVVGRDADDQLTCLDDFVIEDLDPVSPAPALSSSSLLVNVLLLIGVAPG